MILCRKSKCVVIYLLQKKAAHKILSEKEMIANSDGLI
ncbi:hypothetical protein GA0116948_115106 [Chitinophaga costaii]|uniref:Uncharacterized protein n=1 Tax=Chitinophaga costaii TaxID=1335309 RepID=A0A1C4FN15_9BACT|nr:hypothetical protein GA0116948_115106 [Chitinophaga costaii]